MRSDPSNQKLTQVGFTTWAAANSSSYQRGNLVFGKVHEPEKTIVVDLIDERYAKLVIEVADAEAAVRLIKEQFPLASSAGIRYL